MFEGVGDAEVVAAIEEYQRAEAAAGAARLSAIAELVKRRLVTDDDERHRWACDFWDAAAAEIAAAMGIGHRAASKEMRIALALRDRLPKVAALYAEGAISSKVIAMITWRTQLVDTDQALALIDAEIADRAASWDRLSEAKLEKAVDAWVDRFDPGALVRTRIAARGRDVEFGSSDDVTGTTSVWARLYATDAELLHQRLTQMISQVCGQDPRTTAQRRADALGALAAGAEHLTCHCATPDCAATKIEDARATNVVIHIIADHAAATTAPDPHMSGEGPVATPTPEAEPEPQVPDDESVAATHQPEPPTEPGDGPIATPAPDADAPVKPAEPKPPTPPTPRAALIIGGGPIPPSLLGELIAHGATVKPITAPKDTAAHGYRPSAKLADFIRMRDLTCRFPGCNRPAILTDIDHTTPYPAGATHPANMKCLCRKHHLLKTYWPGWNDRQLPDGTITWTTPTGRVYTTRPGSHLYFPTWHTTTGPAPPPATTTTTTKPGDRTVMMPRRQRTRAADHAQHIKTERARNDTYVAHRNKPPPT